MHLVPAVYAARQHGGSRSMRMMVPHSCIESSPAQHPPLLLLARRLGVSSQSDLSPALAAAAHVCLRLSAPQHSTHSPGTHPAVTSHTAGQPCRVLQTTLRNLANESLLSRARVRYAKITPVLANTFGACFFS